METGLLNKHVEKKVSHSVANNTAKSKPQG